MIPNRTADPAGGESRRPEPEPGREVEAPPEPLLQLFLRFLQFGLLAWGGPVAQIAMIRKELVEEQRWVSPERFNRVLAVYQALPGPEAHELCVYFGMISRGRPGAFLAGLGFMLPGFVLMFTLSWVYVTHGVDSAVLRGIFAGLQPAVVALVFRAVYQIGRHALTDRWLWAIALGAGLGSALGVHFLVLLGASGVGYALVRRRPSPPASGALLLALTAVPVSIGVPLILSLFFSGLRSGLLTFGGAYTVIPYLQHDAVRVGAWMTNEQFLDGLALSSLLPAPLVIFSTFVGYVGGGPVGSLALTAGIFLPAFAFTMVGHGFFDRVIENATAREFLDGVTAGVVGLIAATAAGLFGVGVGDLAAAGIFLAALLALWRLRAKAAVALVMLVAGAAGFVVTSWR